MSDPYSDQLDKLLFQKQPTKQFEFFKVVKVSQELKLMPNGNIAILKNQQNIIYYNDNSDVILPSEFLFKTQIKYEGQIDFLELVPLNEGTIECQNIKFRGKFFKGFVSGPGKMKQKASEEQRTQQEKYIVCSFQYSLKHGEYSEQNEKQKILGYCVNDKQHGKFIIENNSTKEKVIYYYDYGQPSTYQPNNTNQGIMRYIAYDSQNTISNYILDTLDEGKWINEIIIDFYIRLVNQYYRAQNKVSNELQILNTLQTQDIFSSEILNDRELNFVALLTNIKQMKEETEQKVNLEQNLKVEDQIQTQTEQVKESEGNSEDFSEQTSIQKKIKIQEMVVQVKNQLDGKQKIQNSQDQLQNDQIKESQQQKNLKQQEEALNKGSQYQKSETQQLIENKKIKQEIEKLKKQEVEKKQKEQQKNQNKQENSQKKPISFQPDKNQQMQNIQTQQQNELQEQNLKQLKEALNKGSQYQKSETQQLIENKKIKQEIEKLKKQEVEKKQKEQQKNQNKQENSQKKPISSQPDKNQQMQNSYFQQQNELQQRNLKLQEEALNNENKNKISEQQQQFLQKKYEIEKKNKQEVEEIYQIQQEKQSYQKHQENQVKLDLKKKYILAINVNRCHFVILYYQNHQLYLLNSMNDRSSDKKLLSKVSEIFQDSQLKFKIANVTQQSNGYDCGIHAIYNFLQIMKMKEGEENLDFQTNRREINQLRYHLKNVILNRHAHILPVFKK